MLNSPFITSVKIFSQQNLVYIIKMALQKSVIKIHKLENNFYVDQTAIDNLSNLQNIIILRTNKNIINIINKGQILTSNQSIYKASIPAEREIYEMFGIIFTEAYDLRRLLCDYSFQGYPLKKSFPLYGTSIVLYTLNTIKHTKIVLSQMMRQFNQH